MAECHARLARELIAEKKEEGNVKNLSQVVNQLKGKMKSKDTVKTLIHSKVYYKIITDHYYPEIRKEKWIQE